MINRKTFEPNLLKLTKNHRKTFVFTTLDLLKLKKLMIMKISNSVNPLYLLANYANHEKNANFKQCIKC